MTRGYSIVALDNPKDKNNVGSAMRAVWTYESAMLVIAKGRFERAPTDTFKAWRHIPVVRTDSVFDALPYDCVPVAVDLVDGATPLPEYKHPERAFYIFGAEDATLGERIIGKCRDKIMVPMRGCMNLAATINVVLYDRLSKRQAI